MTPPLLSNLEGLIGLSRQHGIDVRPTLLRVVTDLYVQKPVHSPDEASQYTALALRLLDVVDAGTRAIVKQRLASYPATPPEVSRRLFGGQSDARTAARTQSAAAAKAEDPAAAAPHRTAAPADRAAGRARALDSGSFFAADSAERRRILGALEHADAPARPMPPRDHDAIQRLEQSALGGRPGDFVRELERALGVPRGIAQRIVNDPSGEPIVVAAKGLAIPLPVLQRILLFVNPAIGHSVRRVYDLSALFDEVSLRAARHLLALWRSESAEASPGMHQSAPAHNAARRLREPAASLGRERSGPIDIDEDLFLDPPQRVG